MGAAAAIETLPDYLHSPISKFSLHTIRNIVRSSELNVSYEEGNIQVPKSFKKKEFMIVGHEFWSIRARPPCPFPSYYPLHFVPGAVVLKLKRIPKHEELLQSGLLVKIVETFKFSEYDGGYDGYGGVAATFTTELCQVESPTDDKQKYYLADTHRRIFFSHRWKQHDNGMIPTPDDEQNTKLKKMQSIVKENDLVWMDYMCIPQDTQDKQLEAIQSLPHYIGESDCVHILTTDPMNREQYKARAFTNLELVCASIPFIIREDYAYGVFDISVATLCKIFDEDGEIGYPFLSPAKAQMYNYDDLPKIVTLLESIKKMCTDTLHRLNSYSYSNSLESDIENCRRFMEFL